MKNYRVDWYNLIYNIHIVKKILSLLIFYIVLFNTSFAVTIGLHGLQSMGDIKDLTRWESQHDNKAIDIIWLIFDQYEEAESVYLHKVVQELGKERIYHISLSPYGYTAGQVAQGIYDKEYKRFFQEIKAMNIKVVFRTMHEMNGWRYSRASKPEDFKKARQYVHTMARKDFNLQSDTLLFSLSFNSQDLPTTDELPTQESVYEYCSQWRINNKGRCPRMEDYYPGSNYVDLIGVTLYNRGRSRADNRSIWKDPNYLLNEAGLIERLHQWGKPIIIDELWSTAVNFDGTRTQEKTREVFLNDTEKKNTRLREWRNIFWLYPKIVGIVYFNVDHTDGATKQVLWQADRSIVMSPFIDDYSIGKRFILNYGDDALKKLFVLKKKPAKRLTK